MKITRAGLRGMVAEALQEMSMYGGEEEEEMFEARRPLSPGFHAAKRRMGGYPSLSAEELEGAEMPTMPLTRRVGRGEPVGPVDWNDFAPYGMDQVGEAFVKAGGDAAAALQILQAGLAAAAEDEDF